MTTFYTYPETTPISNATVYDIAIPSASSAITDIESVISNILLNVMTTGDTLTVSSTDSLNSSCIIQYTDKFEGRTPQVKRKLLGVHCKSEMTALSQFLGKVKAQGNTNSEEDLNLVSYLNLVADRRKTYPPNTKYHLLMFGSPLYTAEKALSMKDAFLSDGYLLSDHSIFSTGGREEALKDVYLHLFYKAEKIYFCSYAVDIHREKIKRFWALFVKKQGGNLCTFSTDTSLLNNLKTMDCKPDEYEISQKDLALCRHLFMPHVVEEWKYTLPPIPPAAPKDEIGDLTIGIQWSYEDFKDVDVDLYVKLQEFSELSYANPSNGQGIHVKDYLNSPKNGYETVVFHGKVYLKDVSVFVNHYSGGVTKDITVKARITFNGTHYYQEVLLTSREGDQGKGDRTTANTWTKIDLIKALGLTK